VSWHFLSATAHGLKSLSAKQSATVCMPAIHSFHSMIASTYISIRFDQNSLTSPLAQPISTPSFRDAPGRRDRLVGSWRGQYGKCPAAWGPTVSLFSARAGSLSRATLRECTLFLLRTTPSLLQAPAFRPFHTASGVSSPPSPKNLALGHFSFTAM
jgi:hypothetical protein